MFAIPLLPIEESARYWRCEHCFSAYVPNELALPTSVPLVKRICVYLLLGYEQHSHLPLAQEICRKLTGFDLPEEELTALRREISAGKIDMVEQVSRHTAALNGPGKQQIIEAAFLATYACCDLQYEDRLRVNLIGNALGADLPFVDYAIAQARKQNYYGIHRLAQLESTD